MKKNALLILFTAVLCLLFNSCCEKYDECKNKKQDVSVKHSLMDSLSKLTITESRLTPELLWKFGRLGEGQLSPDGSKVIYTVTRYSISANKRYTDVFIIPAGGGEAKQLTDFVGSELNPRWTPDGKHIGFLSDESGSLQIWEMNNDGSDKQQISFINGDINGFEYAPDGTHIFFLMDVKTDSTPAEKYADLPLVNAIVAEDLMYRHWNSWHDYKYSHIFIAKKTDNVIKSGKDIMEGEQWDSPLSPFFDIAETTWSPDSKIIAYTCKKFKGKDYAVSTNSDIYLYYIETGKTENLTEGLPGYDKYPHFSPDGKKIAWECMLTPGYESDKKRLYVYDFHTKERKDITSVFDQDVENIVWKPDNKEIFFISGYHATKQIYKINLETGLISQITKGIHNYNTISLAQQVMIGEKMTMSMTPEIFKIDESTGEETQITFTNKNIYDKIELGKVEEWWLKTYDGLDMLVWLIYPPGFTPDQKYPALLYCQGGPQSAVDQFFSYRWNFQIMAANGYIVIAPNRRGVPSFGTAWNDQIAGDYGGKNMRDYLTAVDVLGKEPYIDETRLGAIGASYGGYSVFWLAGHHEKRFKAFIAHCGMFNLESQYAATEEMFFVNHDLEGAYWQKPKPRSFNYSPHLYVDKWDTPIMIVTGGNDFRIPYTESLQAFNSAKLVGVEAKLLFFPEESHFVLKPQNSIFWQREFFGWLDKYLK